MSPVACPGGYYIIMDYILNTNNTHGIFLSQTIEKTS